MTLEPDDIEMTQRQAEILAIVQQTGFATLESLAERYRVSMQTVRRDVIALTGAGYLQRFHGGAGPADVQESARLAYETKQTIDLQEKQEIGRLAAGMIPDGAVIYLDVGTTIEACATILAQRRGFTIFTNSMPSAMKFDPRASQVFVLPGRVAGRDGSLVGMEALNVIGGVNIDFALIGCSTIDNNDRAMDFDMDKIAIKKAAMAAAGKSLLLATRAKFGRSALAVVAPLEAFDMVVTVPAG